MYNYPYMLSYTEIKVPHDRNGEFEPQLVKKKIKLHLEVRTLIYTTNTIEGFNRQLRKVTKSKGVFPSDDSLLKMLYLAMMDITKKMDRKAPKMGTNSFSA